MTQEEFTKLALEWAKENPNKLVKCQKENSPRYLEAELRSFSLNPNLYSVDREPLTEILTEWESKKENKITQIKPLDWDSLPKVWASSSLYADQSKCGVLMGVDKDSINPYRVLYFSDIDEPIIDFFDTISLTDPRPKKKTRLMTAEELNDIYWQAGKDLKIIVDLVFRMDSIVDKCFLIQMNTPPTEE